LLRWPAGRLPLPGVSEKGARWHPAGHSCATAPTLENCLYVAVVQGAQGHSRAVASATPPTQRTISQSTAKAQQQTRPLAAQPAAFRTQPQPRAQPRRQGQQPAAGAGPQPQPHPQQEPQHRQAAQEQQPPPKPT
jgi:hypothetical protein